MITHKCEACGKSEDVSGKQLDRGTAGAKLCYECHKVYRDLKEALEKKLCDQVGTGLATLSENMVTEVRKKRGIEPKNQGFKIDRQIGQIATVNLTLSELPETWLNSLPQGTLSHSETGIMFAFMQRVVRCLTEYHTH